MWTPSEFDQALSVVSEKYKTLERQMSWLKPYDRDQAYALYRNANDSVFGFLVCGRTRINIVDPVGGYLTVTGRELTGLKEFGY